MMIITTLWLSTLFEGEASMHADTGVDSSAGSAPRLLHGGTDAEP